MKHLIVPAALLAAACTISVRGPVSNVPSYERIDEPVEFYFETDSRDQRRVSNVANTLEPHFPAMSWRIGSYEPSPDDGLVIVVRERAVRVSTERCEDCARSSTSFVIYDRGERIGSEVVDDCSISRPYSECFSPRRLVSTIDQARASTRRGAPATTE